MAFYDHGEYWIVDVSTAAKLRAALDASDAFIGSARSDARARAEIDGVPWQDRLRVNELISTGRHGMRRSRDGSLGVVKIVAGTTFRLDPANRVKGPMTNAQIKAYFAANSADWEFSR